MHKRYYRYSTDEYIINLLKYINNVENNHRNNLDDTIVKQKNKIRKTGIVNVPKSEHIY